MSYNKSKSALPEKSRFILFEIGLIIAISAALVAFNYKIEKDESGGCTLPIPHSGEIEEITPPTRHKMEVPPPPSPTVINIVDNFQEVEIDFVVDVEDDFYTPAESYLPVIPEEEPVDDEVYEFVDARPEFPGGPNALQKWLKDNIHYPRGAIEAGITGTVYLKFVVSKDGSVRDVKVMRGESSMLNREALRVGRMMPDWKPGIIKGVPVNSTYVIPVKFMLQ